MYKTLTPADTNPTYGGTDPESGVSIYHTEQGPRLQARITFMNARDFAKYETQPLSPVLGPITQSSVTMVYAARGVGKTFFCLSAALAMTQCTEFNGWRPSRPFKVGYIDGEMQGRLIQERLQKLNQGALLPENLLLCTPELGHIPDIGEDVWRKAVIDTVKEQKIEVVFLDNLSTLVRTGRENDREYWLPIQNMIIQLRSMGIAVILVHHANKAGDQRGTSSKEDIADVVMRLSKPEHTSMVGAHFRLDITKGRNLSGTDFSPCEIRLFTDDDGFFQWEKQDTKDIEKPLTNQQTQARNLLAQGRSQREVSQELGVNESTVSKWKSKGILQTSEKDSNNSMQTAETKLDDFPLR
jgi:putative DNA primase/helicase